MDPVAEDEIAKLFFSACQSGDASKLQSLLDKEPYASTLINLTNTGESSARKVAEKTIYTATLRGHQEVLKKLLQHGANPNAQTTLGTPIYAAVKSGNLDIVRLLIKNKAEFRYLKGGFSPLYVSCIEGRLQILKYLVSIGADIFSFDNPPLVFTACTAGQLEVLRYLMEEMDWDIHRTVTGENGIRTDGKDTLLFCACQRNKLDIAGFLVRHGAAVTRTIMSRFPQIIQHILQQRFRPLGPATPTQMYHARLKELGLSELPWSIMVDYASTIVKLELRENTLVNLPQQIFKMPNLKILDVSNNQLSEICLEEVKWECTSLTDFDVSHNSLTYIPSGLFLLPELANLQLSYNLLAHLPGDPEDATAQSSSGFPPNIRWTCDKLKKLDLSHNRLRSLPDTFDDLRRLSVLNVSHNYLKELPQSSCWGCINLVHLDVAHNQLPDLPIGAANYWMHSLERLYLSQNKLTEISRNLTELTALTTLDLSYNMIKYLPPTSDWTGSRLSKLNLSFNQLTKLSHDRATQQKSVQEQQPPPEPAARHPSAVNRFLRRTPARAKREHRDNLAPDPQEAMPAIDEQPRELPAGLWSSCLQSLFLQGNQIKWLPDYLGKFNGLQRLDISGNSDVATLPLTLGMLRNCWEITLNGVRISNAPHHLLPGSGRGSTRHLLAYLRAQLRHCVPYNRMKLMVVGLQGRGKTTLLSVLRTPNQPLPENVSTVGVVVNDWVIGPPLATKKKKQDKGAHNSQSEVVFSIWDMAGQEVYYATHQCFLSRNTLYLVVWNMEEGEKGIDYLRPWLLNIQARAPHSPVIIVGTHLDKLPLQKSREVKEQYKQRIVRLYRKPGYPNIEAIKMVSCLTQDGLRELSDRIYYAAVSAIDHDTKEHIIGMQVPSSYVALQKVVSEEVIRCREKEIPPVLNQKEFAVLAESIENNDITDPEELSLAAAFLHDNGVLLHYNDHLRGLNNLYFIDPIWLADMLAEVVTVPERQSFVHNGILKESNVAFIFHDNKRFPSKFFQQYLQLLERFEIALSLGNGQRLIPSMLPFQRPIMNFVDPEPVVRSPSEVVDKYVLRKDVTGGTSGEMPTTTIDDPLTPRVVEGLEVVNFPLTCVRRRYRMCYIPSGFWSRLISRLIINLKRSGLEESSSSGNPPIIYWKRGIVVLHSTGRFLVESIQNQSSEMSGVSLGGSHMEASAKYVGDGVDKFTLDPQGVDVTVWSNCGDFSAMGYVVDQLDSLIDEWFPGLNELDVEGDWLVQRQVLWKVPKSLVEKSLSLKGNDPLPPNSSKPRSWGLTDTSEQARGEMMVFDLDACASDALKGDTVVCQDYKIRIPLRHLVPDLLLTDLPPQLNIDVTQFEYNPKDPATRLGRGGAGAVYKGRYKREVVAVKEFLTSAQAEHTGDTLEDQRSHHSEDDDIIRQEEALFLFRDLRQEVTVLAQLNHPNIVALLGVSFHPMCMVIELAPMGSLFGVLDKRIEQYKAAQADRVSIILRMPGGVLGHEMSTRIALQVALAVRYLHKHGIVYRDLKSDNVLIWSLDEEEPVNAKLADYGISRFANPGGVKGEEGTPGYLAPEAIRRRGEDQAFDEKVDIFSYAMLLFELLTGQRPFESLTSTTEINQAITKGERPPLSEGNGEPSFPGMVDLMYDSWIHSAGDRPSANELVMRVSEPGFMCREHTLTRSKDHPLEKIDTIYARPILADDISLDRKSFSLWTWARQDADRNFSIIDVRKGVFNLPKKLAPGGRVYCMTATGEVEKRIWIGTADCEIQVYGYKGVGDPQCLWTFCMKDSVLALDTEVEGGRVKRVFASLANGTLCVFSRKSISSVDHTPIGDAKYISEACTVKCDEEQFQQEAEDWAQPLILRLGEGSKAAKCVTFVGGKQLWCGCGNYITVIDSKELRVLQHIPVFVKRMALVNELVSNGVRVWGVGRQLSCVMEWDVATFSLVHIFNCSTIDPTDENVISDPKLIEDLFDPDTRPKAGTISEGQVGPGGGADKREGFSVENNPLKVQATGTPFSQRTTRTTLRGIRPRQRAQNIKEAAPSMRKRIATSRELVLRKHQGSTRTTSLVIVDDTLWVGRGMGDVLVIDIGNKENHGRVLARLSTEESEKYGNRSYNKLVSVAGKYVVSSQWLEPVDVRKSTLTSTAPPPNSSTTTTTRYPSKFNEQQPTAHQAITIWKAWNNEDISGFMAKRSAMLMLEDEETV